MTQKDELELAYWQQANIEEHRAKLALYLWAFGEFRYPDRVLEIGCGPLGGFLPLLSRATIRLGVDPLVNEYRRAGLLQDDDGIAYVAARFEEWATAKRIKVLELFDAIFSADSLDHGEMSFYLIPRIAELLAPGGRFYLHVHLRPGDLINLIHDHSLTIAQLDAALARTDLVELRRDIYPSDVDGGFCEAVVGVWEKR
jgi:SAM-dependent methyltransferase